MRGPYSPSRKPALRVRRSTLMDVFPVEPARSDRSRIAVELRQNAAAPFVTIEHQIRGDESAPWYSRRAVAVRLEEVSGLLAALSAASSLQAALDEPPVEGQPKPWDVPGFEAVVYDEVDGIRVVALDAPHRPGHVEIAIRTSGENPQSIAFSPEDAGRLLSALCAACVDIGLADQIVREILEREDRPLGTATTH